MPGYYGGSIPWIKIGDLTDGPLSSAEEHITEAALAASSAVRLPARTLLVAMYGSIGKLGITTMECSTNQAIAFCLVNESLCSTTYLFWLLRHLRQNLVRLGKGGTQQNISQTVLRPLTVPVPPLQEQHRIVAEVEKQLTRLDAAASALKRARANLNRYAASVLSAACLGRLVSKEAELCGEGRTEPLTASDCPEGWSYARAEEVCDFITKGTTPAATELFPEQGDIPFIKVYNLTFDGSLDFSIAPTFVRRTIHERQLRRSRVVPGDVLMNIVGPPLGKVSMVPNTYPEWNVNQAIAIFRPKPGLNRRFLGTYLRSAVALSEAKSQAKATAGQSNLTLEICRNLRIPIPPYEEQLRIANEVDRRTSVIRQLETAIDANLKRAERLRQSILKRAFEGKLVPQDLNDEPAILLLERIRATRAAQNAKPNVRRLPKRAYACPAPDGAERAAET